MILYWLDHVRLFLFISSCTPLGILFQAKPNRNTIISLNAEMTGMCQEQWHKGYYIINCMSLYWWHCTFYNWLVVWNIFYFSIYSGNFIIPSDFHIFKMGWYTTNQELHITGNLMRVFLPRPHGDRKSVAICGCDLRAIMLHVGICWNHRVTMMNPI